MYLIDCINNIIMEIPTHKRLVADIQAFLTRKGMKAHEFGKMYLNDNGAISRLKKGADPRLSTVIKIYKVIIGK